MLGLSKCRVYTRAVIVGIRQAPALSPMPFNLFVSAPSGGKPGPVTPEELPT